MLKTIKKILKIFKNAHSKYKMKEEPFTKKVKNLPPIQLRRTCAA